MTEERAEPLDPILAKWYDELTRDHQERKPGLWRLPPEHAFAHHYCFFLNDTLGKLIRDGEESGLFSVSFSLANLPSEQRQEFVNSELVGEDLVSWLEEHGYTDVVNDLTERQITVAVLTDAAQFIYEALRCSEKGKLTVTYALLRKPLRENLLFLELLLTDRTRFLELLANDTEELGIFALPKSASAKPIIESAVRAIGREETLNPSFLYDLRYAKHKHFSLEATWNKATHLVTTDKHFATEANNLNFIFSDRYATQSQWDDLYRKLPILLFYFVEVAVALIKRLAGPDRLEDESASRTRELGFSLAGYFQLPTRPFSTSHLAGFTSECPLCKRPILDSTEAIMEMYLHSKVTCQHCGVSINLDGNIPPEWAIKLRALTLPLMLPLRRAYRALRSRPRRPNGGS